MKNIDYIRTSTFCSTLLVILVVGYGVLLRVSVNSKTTFYDPIIADAKDYYTCAYNLANHGVYSNIDTSKSHLKPQPTALRSPGFPFFSAVFMTSNVKTSYYRTIWAQTILQVFSFVLITYMLVCLFGNWWSLLPISIIWTFPHFVTINSYFLTESIFTSFVALSLFSLWFFTEELDKPKLAACIVGGLIGIAALTRPVLEYFPFFFATLALILNRSKARTIAIFFLTAMTPIIAWKIRNLFAINALSDPVLMINTLYHGSFPDFMYENNPKSHGFPYRFDPRSAEVYNGLKATLNVIYDRFKANPIAMSKWYIYGKQFYLWQWNILAGQGDIFIYPVLKSPYQYIPDMIFTHAINKILHPVWILGGLLSGCLLSLSLLIKKSDLFNVWFFSSLIIVYTVLIHTITAPYPRYGIPFKLIIILLFGYGLKSSYIWIKLRNGA